MRRETDAILSLQRFFAGVLPEPWDIRTELEAGEAPERPFAMIEQAGNAETTGAPAGQEIAVPMTANLYLVKGTSREAATEAALELRERVWSAVKWGPDLRRVTTDRIPLYSYEPRVEKHRFKVTATGGTFIATVDSQDTAALAPNVSAASMASAIATAIDATPSDVVGYKRGVGLIDIHYVGDLAGQRIGDPEIDGTNLTGPPIVATARTMLEGAPAPWRGPSDFMRVTSFAQNTVRDESDPALVSVHVDLRLTFVRGLPLPLEHRILQRFSATVGNGGP